MSYPVNWSHPKTRELYRDRLPFYPDWLIESCRVQIEANHYQTVERLKERGFLHPIEVYIALLGKHWKEFNDDWPSVEEATEFIIERILKGI